jgi:rare lipoprotein A (peptidoglycan hydrolase)
MAAWRWLKIGIVLVAAAGPAHAEEGVVDRSEIGIASWYGDWHQGRPTASGAPFDMHQMTAAHPTLPLDTLVRVTHLASGRVVTVTINDRGPYFDKRVLDLSAGAAEALGIKHQGIAPVRIEVLGRATARPPGAEGLFREFAAYRDRRVATLRLAGLADPEERDEFFREFLSYADAAGSSGEARQAALFAEFVAWLGRADRPPRKPTKTP